MIVGDIEIVTCPIVDYSHAFTYLGLDDLVHLERICRRALPFPSLKEIIVRNCYKLKELPLNCDNAKALRVIHGEEEWWEGLVRNDPASKQVFSAKFFSLFGYIIRGSDLYSG